MIISDPSSMWRKYDFNAAVKNCCYDQSTAIQKETAGGSTTKMNHYIYKA